MSQRPDNIKYLLIDIDDTLLDFRKCSYAAVKKVFEAEQLPFSSEVYDYYVSSGLELWSALERGELTLDELCDIRWNGLFEKYGIQRNGVAFDKMYHAALATEHFEVDGAGAILRYLADKYVLCAASNGILTHQKQRLAADGMLPLFKQVFVSDDVGFNKPDKRFFTHCLAALGNPSPQSVMIIGDRISSDIEGGKSCGLITCLFDRKKTAKPEDADYIIYTLDELRNIL